jgi:murein DD-endopeptidase MepM/ murein hydrolase activator NlpD
MSRLALALLALAALAARPAGAGPLRLEPDSVPIGGLAVVRVAAADASGTFDGEPLRFRSDGEESVAWIGIDLERKSGRYPVVVESSAGRARGELEVRPTTFPEERLTVSKAYTDLDAETLARVRREQKLLADVWEASAPGRLWEGSFVRPATGPSGSPFGLRRFFNGEPRSPHAGIDIKAPTGAPVFASNRGRVALVDDLFFTGKTIVLDHGLGVFTLYVHLSETKVAAGRIAEKGETIGLVGATGRVTGPHLHFATRVGGVRIDPDALFERAVD